MQFAGKKVLVVEDDLTVGQPLCDELRELGAIVFGPAPTVFYASQLLGGRGVDAAILDTVLHGEAVYPLADRLAQKSIPFIFALEDGGTVLPPRHGERPCVTKPIQISQVLERLTSLATEASMRPAPGTAPMQPQPARVASPGGLRAARAVNALLRQRLPQC